MPKRIAKNLVVGGSTKFLVIFSLVACLGFYWGSKIQLKLSLTDLLPENHPAVVKFDKLTEVVGGVGFFALVLTAEDGKSHIEIAPMLAEEFKKSELVRSVFYHREKRFFVDRLLYYLDLPQLRDLEQNIKKEITGSKRKMFDIGLWDDEEKPATKTEVFNDDLKKLAQESASISPYLTSKDNKHLLLMVKPSFDSMDMAKNEALIAIAEKIVKEKLPPTVTYQFAERYYNKVVETKQIEHDIFFLGGLSIAIILFILYLYMRSVRAILVIFIPVLLGLGVTVGTTYLVIGHINIVTGFLMGVLSGLGVDYGIHLVLRLNLERREPSSEDPDPIWRTLASSGHSVFVGAFSASLAFFFLCFSSFRAFSEFGFICGVGILAVLIALLCSFHSLARFFKLDTRPLPTKEVKSRPFPVLSLPRGFRIGVGASFALILAALFVRFEYDFDKMMSHSKKMRELADLVDYIYDRSSIPSAISTQSRDEALAIEKYLKDKFMPATISEMISGASIVPEYQAEKHAILLRIKKDIKPIKDKWIEESLGVPGKAVRDWMNAVPFTYAELPSHVQDALRGTLKSGYLLYIYPAMKLSEATAVKRWAEMMRGLERQFPNILTGSDAVVFADILDLISKDGGIILFVIFVSVGFFIWVNVREVRASLLSYLPLLVALPIGMGLMALFRVKFNIFNIAIIPSFVAMGIDVPIHIVHRAHETKSGFKAVRDLVASINLALITGGVGFGVLVFARAGVLRSLGAIAILGTLAIWWVGVFVLPSYLERHYRRNEKPSMKKPVAPSQVPPSGKRTSTYSNPGSEKCLPS